MILLIDHSYIGSALKLDSFIAKVIDETEHKAYAKLSDAEREELTEDELDKYGLFGSGIFGLIKDGQPATITETRLKELIDQIKSGLPKKQKIAEIEKAFNFEQQTGSIDTTLGYFADCRYYVSNVGIKDDLRIVQQALKRGDTSFFKDVAGETHSTTIEQFEIIVDKVEQAFTDRYLKRLGLLGQIQAATTEELENINW